jgi:hypothetical protein
MLKGLPNLREIICGESQITDKGLAHLKRLKQLFEVNIQSGHVTEDGIDALREALPKAVIRIEKLPLPKARQPPQK